MISALFWLAHMVVQLLIWAILASVALSWLVNFGIVNTRSPFVYSVGDFLTRVTEPMLRPIRRVLPDFGNFDLSPLVALLLLEAVQILLGNIEMRLLLAGGSY